MAKCLGTLKSYTTATLKHYSIEIGSISFSSYYDTQKFHHLLGCHAISINSSLLFLSVLRFLNLICKAKSLIRITVSGSSSSKLLSRLILLNLY